MLTPHFALPVDAVLPDYGESGLLGLAGSLRAWLHDRAAGWVYGQVAAGDRAVVVLLVVDGLGDQFLCSAGEGSGLQRLRRGTLTSVCPSTTASAVTTLLTGVSPAVHGLNGWFIRDRRFGGVIAPLPLMHRGGGSLQTFRLLHRLFPQPPMFEKACKPVIMLSPQEIAYSPFSLHHARGARMHHYEDLQTLATSLVDAARALRTRGGLVHAYYPGFDALCHEFGCRSAQALSCFEHVDAVFSWVCGQLAGEEVHIVVTADHGFIDAVPERAVRIPARSEVSAMLAGPLFGERRLAFCQTRPGAEQAFEAWAAEALHERAVLVPSPEFVAAGMLGPGKPHRLLEERVGNYVLLMEAGCTVIDELEGETPHELVGVHGGLTADEMRVPLISVVT
jgi:hypothetical protein